MRYFFQDSFIRTIRQLLKKNSYKDCEQALVNAVFKTSKKDLFVKCAAHRLNPNAKNPIVKMRIAGRRGKSSSYRLYFFVIQHKDELYFGHLYPKTGSRGQNALKVKEEKNVIKTLLEEIKNKSLIEV